MIRFMHIAFLKAFSYKHLFLIVCHDVFFLPVAHRGIRMHKAVDACLLHQGELLFFCIDSLEKIKSENAQGYDIDQNV